MSLVDKIMSEFENGYSGNIIGKIGYWILAPILFTILTALALIALPFIKLSEKRAAKRAKDPSSYDRMRIKDSHHPR